MLFATSGAHIVCSMKYLRHPPLVGWTLVTAALITALIAAMLVSKTSSKSPVSHSMQIADKQAVMALRNRLASLHAALVPPGQAIPSWAAQTATLAQQDATQRMKRSDNTDILYRQYLVVKGDALSLSGVDLTSLLKLQTAASLVEADMDTLASIVDNDKPQVAPLPGETISPSDGNSAGNYVLPVVPAPNISIVPFNPANPAAPEQPGLTTGGNK